MAWRNIRRNLRRTLITLAAISFGLASIIVFFGFTDGFHAQWIENTVKAYSGHIIVHTEGFHDDPQIGSAIEDPARVLDVVEGESALSTYTTRIEIAGLVSTAENSAGVLIRGVDIIREIGITSLDKRVIEGRYLEDGWSPGQGREALIGHRLAKKLKASIGDKLVIMLQAADGSLGAELFRVAGIFRMGSIDLDASLVVVSIEALASVAVIDGMVTEVALILNDSREAREVAERLDAVLGPMGYEVLPWQVVMPALSEMIELDNAFMYAILVIVLVVVSLGIMNTMLMSIMERTRELGIMKALGTRPVQIVALVMLESVFLGFIGALSGVVIGIGTNALISINGFDLSKWAGAMELMAALDPVVYPETHIANVLWAAAAIFVTAVVVSIYPAVKAARLKPVDAIHFV